MDRIELARIDEQLVASEVAELCFLCRDVIPRKRLEGVRDAKDLFLRLEERSLLNNALFLSELLNTIHRVDLLSYLETESMQLEQSDASPTLSSYRVMLYKIYNDLTQQNFENMKFVFEDDLGRRITEMCKTALDLFGELENANKLSDKNLTKLLKVLGDVDQQLASTVQSYIDGMNMRGNRRPIPRGRMHHQSPQDQTSASLPVLESLPNNSSVVQSISSDADPQETCDSDDYYTLEHSPRGLCVIFNNENYRGPNLTVRRGTQKDVEKLVSLFYDLGFKVMIQPDLTADEMLVAIEKLGKNNFSDHDALVVCVLSHGDNGCVYGIDEREVYLKELTQPFTSSKAPSLAGKPKLFFIQACQGRAYQTGYESWLEDDGGSVAVHTVPRDADFLMGMATLPEYRSFRSTSKGSIYIQELCKQLRFAAESSEKDDILTVLTRVNREVSRGNYQSYKQMPEPKYTLTKKLVLKYVK